MRAGDGIYGTFDFDHMIDVSGRRAGFYYPGVGIVEPFESETLSDQLIFDAKKEVVRRAGE